MRSHRATAVLLVAFAAASCGGDGGTPPPDNRAPVAAFTPPACTVGVACTFTDASTDPDGNNTITGWEWDFGDGTGSMLQNPARNYPEAGEYDVTLTVTDNAGATNAVTHTVTASVPGANQPPTAAFTVTCSSLDCTFNSAGSTDADGTIASYDWEFSDGESSTEANPVHTFNVTELTTASATLTVTDDDGATGEVSHDFTVAPPAVCADVTCDLTMPDARKVTITLTAEDCNADGNTLRILEPVDTTLFTDGCHIPIGSPEATFELDDNGAAFAPGTTIKPEVLSGSNDLGFPPTLRIRGGTQYPTWVLEFDDGEAGANEPDFNDLEITITAHQ